MPLSESNEPHIVFSATAYFHGISQNIIYKTNSVAQEPEGSSPH
jgi:hypothetical protein